MRRLSHHRTASILLTLVAPALILMTLDPVGKACQAAATQRSLASVSRSLAAQVSVFTGTTAKGETQKGTKKGTGNGTGKPAQLLPEDFAGWHRTSTPVVDQPADKSYADALHEYGLTQRVKSDYTRGPDKLSVTASQFGDASGAYGAYTASRDGNWPREDVGQDGSSNNSRVIFWVGNTLVDANFDHVSSMTGSELRELAGQLPRPVGPAAIPPPLLHYLPQAALESQTTRYALGPLAYTREGGVLPASLVGFDHGAEAITAAYSTRDGEGALTMLSYPTPQVAAERQRAIDDFLKAGDAKTPSNSAAGGAVQGSWPKALADSNPAILLVRRSGPIVAFTSGTLPPADARKLLSQVNYTADVTWNNANGYNSEVNKTAHLLLGILVLSGILGAAAILLGLFLGGGRALYRVMRGRPASSLHETDYITLNLGK